MKQFVNNIELSDVLIIGGFLLILFVTLSAFGNDPETAQLAKSFNAIIR